MQALKNGVRFMNKLLKILSENSNLSAKEIAAMLGEPEDYIEKQIRQYEKDGTIKGYKAIIDYDKVKGASATAFIEMKVTPKKDTGFDEIAKQVMAFDEVETVYLMAGAFDLMVLVKGESVTEIAMFVARRLSTIEGVLATNTHFQLKTYKESGIVFFDEESEKDQRSIIL